MPAPADHARLIAPPPLIALAAILAGWGLRFLWPVPLWPWPHRWLPVAGCVAGALAFAPAAALALGRAKTAILPHHSTIALVSAGPFRYTRNPLYLAMGLLVAGTAFAANSLAMLLMVVPWAVVMVRGVIVREERYLEEKFGDDYRAYCRRVRRWL